MTKYLALSALLFLQQGKPPVKPEPFYAFPETISNTLSLSDGGRVLVTCTEIGDWGSDNYRVEDCKMSEGASLEQVMTAVAKDMQRQQKEAEATRKSNQDLIDCLLKILRAPVRVPLAHKHAVADTPKGAK